MNTIRSLLQVTAFLFFAGWLLLLVTGKSLPLPVRADAVAPSRVPAPPVVKPSPIEMLRKLDSRAPVAGGETER